MRSLVVTALLASSVASTSLVAQSLTEHAAAAAGATIGTAAGKPLGTALGKVFGEADKNAATVTATKTTKPVVVTKPAPVATTTTASSTPAPALAPSGGGGDVGGGAGHSTGTAGSSTHRTARRKAIPEEPEEAALPIAAAPVEAVVFQPVVKEPSAQDVAGIQVGATFSELRAALGAPESRVSIPGDDGHLLEICQYWSKGEQIGTVRLDNGRVVSVQAKN